MAKALLERFGYEVRNAGYEFVIPGWVSNLKAGDPNSGVLKARATPDLQVYDSKMNNLYEVEIKTTSLNPAAWRYKCDRINALRTFHPDAFLLVYAEGRHQFFAQRLASLDWGSIFTKKFDDGALNYVIDLNAEFSVPSEIFSRISISGYEAFLNETKEILRGFKTQD